MGATFPFLGSDLGAIKFTLIHGAGYPLLGGSLAETVALEDVSVVFSWFFAWRFFPGGITS